jgi:hypothetical protein
VLELPRPVLKHVRVPRPDELPPGPLSECLDSELIRRGLIAAPLPPGDDEDDDGGDDEPPPLPPLADKLRLLFDAELPGVHSLHTQAVWAAGRVLEFGGKFDNFIKSYDLVKQEGLVFRHLLRLILLCAEFDAALQTAAAADATLSAAAPGATLRAAAPDAALPVAAPADAAPSVAWPSDAADSAGASTDWRDALRDWSDRFTATCRDVDPDSTDKLIEEIAAIDLMAGETAAAR